MLLKNNSRRLITINVPLFKEDPKIKKQVFHKYQGTKILPGNNPAVEIPDDVCDNKFVKSLIKTGDLLVVLDEDNDGDTDDDLSKKTKDELIAIAEMMGLEAKSSMNKADIISLINGESDQLWLMSN